MVDAVILAGSPNSGPLRDVSSEKYEALIPIGKRPMVEYVVDALLATPLVKDIVVAGPEEVQRTLGEKVRWVKAGSTAIQSLINGIKVLSGERRVLVVPADVPLVTPRVIENFLHLCGDQSADLYYPIVRQDTVEARFPSVRRTYATLKEGTFTGGNLFLVNPREVIRTSAKVEEFVDFRKSPLKLSWLLGPTFILKFFLKTLTIGEAQEKFNQLLGVRAVAVISEDPEIGFDVDKPSDLEIAQRELKSA